MKINYSSKFAFAAVTPKEKMNYTIRPLTVEDEPIVWEMLCYASHESSVESVRQQPALARYASDWGRVGDLGCIAEQDTAPLGMAWLRLWEGEDKGFGYIDNSIPELAIAVLPDYRGQGIGTHLLEQILLMAKDRFPAVSLSVRVDNPVVKLYVRSGFVKVTSSEIVNRTGMISFNMLYEFE